MYDQVRDLALGLGVLGFRPGEFAVIWSRNRSEATVADYAVMHAGGVPVFIYNTVSAEQAAYIAGHCEATVAIVEREFLPKLSLVREELPKLRQVNGCTDTNTGFDGVSYQRDWPDGNTAVHPQPWLFSSPLTGPNYNVNYTRMAFEADLPAIETNTCNRSTGVGCTLIPTTDDGQPAAFYPFFSTLHGNGNGHGCQWAFGNDLPGGNDLGRNAQYGTLLTSTYLAFGGGGATVNRINNFRNIISNPCRA